MTASQGARVSSPVDAADTASPLARWSRRPIRLALVVALVGLAVTAATSWTAWNIDHNNEHRLLHVQTRQAGSVIGSTIVGLQSPLLTAFGIASATNGDPAKFVEFMTGETGSQGPFVAASLWRTGGLRPTVLTSAGVPTALDATSPRAAQLMTQAMKSTTFVVTSLTTTAGQRIGYLLGRSGSPFEIYAERAIPANRQVPVESTSAFADLHFATYLGARVAASALQTTDVPPGELPLSGDTTRVEIPFGNTVLTLVASPSGQLGGTLEGELWLIFLAVGVIVTLAAATITDRLVRRRRTAEQDAATITSLYGQLDTLYGEQRTISETLQHALVPQSNPAIPSLEIASRYVAGARGVDVGGDWHSMIRLDDTHFAFVVGDVSGRGVAAAAIMARIRFTLSAYLTEGHAPATALGMCSRQLDVTRDGHMATAVVGVGDLNLRTITIANAGHLRPILISDGRAGLIDTALGPPLGVMPTRYESTTFTMPPGSTLIAYTDGLVERRHEDLDVGLQRLTNTVTTERRPLDDVLSEVLHQMTMDGADDDVAILAFRWASGS